MIQGNPIVAGGGSGEHYSGETTAVARAEVAESLPTAGKVMDYDVTVTPYAYQEHDNARVMFNVMKSAFTNGFDEGFDSTLMGMIGEVWDHAFVGTDGVKNLPLASCTYIGSYAFAGCLSSCTMYMPSVSYIGEGAFRSCGIEPSAFSEAFENVEYIGDSAFAVDEAGSGVDVSLPACTYVGHFAFDNLYVSNAYLTASTVCQIESDTFRNSYDDSDALLHVFVPSSMYSQYMSASCWSQYSGIIETI